MEPFYIGGSVSHETFRRLQANHILSGREKTNCPICNKELQRLSIAHHTNVMHNPNYVAKEKVSCLTCHKKMLLETLNATHIILSSKKK